MADFPIVGIGSSAGGLEALQEFFKAMPADAGLAFVLAAHLDPTQESHLAELIGRCTRMPVEEIGESAAVEANHVYVIAPNQELTISEGVLRSNTPVAPRGHRHPVDSFFRSLAEDQGERAIAIVLSGTGSNGSLGLRFIKAEGGMVIAQRPESATFTGMPRSAIGTGVVDLVLPPGEMPDALVGLVHSTYVREPERAGEEGARPESELRALFALLRAQARREFTGYKRSTLLRRIYRRMGLHRIADLTHYITRLRSDEEEMQALVADLTINVTGFFRDPEAWETLREKVIEPLVAERASESAIRVWVPGCSTGEEAYSIAMLITEVAEAAGKRFDLRLFATDVAAGVLATARAGRYPSSIALDVNETRLRRFFEQEEDTWCIGRSLRESITFAPQNLLQDPPFSRLDLVTCRNLLIYLEPRYQKRVLALFHFALREGAHLFLGTAENASALEDLFQPVSKRWRIYRRIGPTRHDIVNFPLLLEGTPRKDDEADAEPRARNMPGRAGEVMSQALLERFTPASALIDGRARVLYLRGPTDEYVKPPSGEPSYSLLAMAREGLPTALRTLIRKAREEHTEVTGHARVRRGGKLHPVELIVSPISKQQDAADRLIVIFRERPPAAPGAPRAECEPPIGEAALQAELESAREDLRLTISQMDAANEELKASNEEIRSINEELQASNEELETSKEELQSLNEELNTVNSQLQAKVSELEQRTADINNLLNSTDVATLFLDRSLAIRWFTPAMSALFDLRHSDLSRPIAHFTQKFRGGDLIEDAKHVLTRLTPSEAEVQDEDEHWYIRRILPYRSTDDRIDGVTVTFIDLSDRKAREQELEGAKAFAENIVDTVREPLIVLNADLTVRSANESFYQGFEVPREETEGRMIYELGNGQWDIPELRKLLENVLPQDKQFSGFLVEHDFESIGRRVMLLNARRIDHLQLILLAIEDVTARRRVEQALGASEERFRVLVETISQAVWEADSDGIIVEDSPSWRAYTGQTFEECVGYGWANAVHPDDREDVEREWREAVAAGRIVDAEFRLRDRDGEWRWTDLRAAPIRDGEGRILKWVAMNIDITERKEAERERELLARELSHRVKNTLAVVQALAMHTDRRIRSAEGYRDAFLGRLKALSQAHSLLLDANWQSADIRVLVKQALAAYTVDHPDVVTFDGESETLNSKQSLGLALVLHELGTNAAKYGALSHSDGRLKVSWRTADEAGARRVRFEWQERHGPEVSPPTAKGFGSQLIDQAVRYELGGEVELDYAREGLTCTITFPLESTG